MRRRWLVVLAVFALLFVVSATANAAPISWFVQDDFRLTFAAPDSPGTPGSTFSSTGRIVDWTTNSILAYYVMSGTGLLGSVVGSEYVTPYGSVTLNLYNDFAHTTNVWSSTGGYLETHVLLGAPNPWSPDLAHQYLASGFSRPAFVTTPTTYYSVGSGYVNGSGTFDPATTLYMPWFGTYNWNYEFDGAGQRVVQTGNLQGELTNTNPVPEPGSMMLLGTGLVGLAGAVRRRVKK